MCLMYTLVYKYMYNAYACIRAAAAAAAAAAAVGGDGLDSVVIDIKEDFGPMGPCCGFVFGTIKYWVSD